MIRPLTTATNHPNTREVTPHPELRSIADYCAGYATRRAAERISKREVGLLRQSCVRFDALKPDDDLRGVVRENLFFHNTILAVASRNIRADIAERITRILGR